MRRLPRRLPNRWDLAKRVSVGTVWDQIYAASRSKTELPHPEIQGVLDLFNRHQVGRVLDLGCGTGRHLIAFAREGFDTWGLDSSAVGLASALLRLGEMKLSAHLTLHDMQNLPYPDTFFNALISVQVIHHNRLEAIRQTVSEITRVVKPGGLIWITVPVSKNEPSNLQKEVEPGTFVPIDGPEKGLPHHYFRKVELGPFFASFEILELEVDSTNHFSLTARKTE